ncbi:MAG: hypothetical protein HQ582_03130 [Planctomycetes bacterium]|nr:hypothetical protein [Planctomycetota bacterium]
MKYAYCGVVILAFMTSAATAALPHYFAPDRVSAVWRQGEPSLRPPVSETDMRLASVDGVGGLSSDPWCSEPVVGCAYPPRNSCSCPGWFVSAEYLYWRTSRSCRPYVGLNSTGGFDPNENTVVELEGADFDRDSGFRASFGRGFGSCWDVALTYSYFSNDGSAFADDSDARLLPLQAHPGWIAASVSLSTSPGVEEATAALGLDYNTYDLEMGRRFSLCDSLTGRAFAGVRGAQIDQDSVYGYFNIDSGTGAVNAYDRVTQRSEMHGWGFRTGGSLNWNVRGSCRWSLFSRTAVSLLLAETTNTRTEVIYDTDPLSALQGRLVATGECNDVVPALELAIGVRYDHDQFWLAAGYEFSTWFNMVNDIRFAEDTNPGDPSSQQPETQVIAVDRGSISFDGLFATAGCDF